MTFGASLRVRSGCKRLLAPLLFGWVLASAAPALAQNSDEMARRHFESGVAYLEESDYENALKAFQKAYDLSKRPTILLNIATVQERRGDTRGAIDALKAYVDVDPTGEHVETAKLRIQNLEKRLADQAQSEPSATPPPANPPPAAEPPAPAPPPASTREPSPPNLLPAYIAFGAAGLAAGGAVVTGILANNEHSDLEDTCAPSCSDDAVASGKTLAWVSTGLTGGAIVGAGVGLVLLLTASSQEEARAASPWLSVSVGPKGSGARATFAF
jgi:tetratricopeptide (TPR) repeat protein